MENIISNHQRLIFLFCLKYQIVHEIILQFTLRSISFLYLLFGDSCMELKLTQIVENLEKIAMEDGKITEEENKFLETLKHNVEKFQMAVKKAEADEIITDNEFHDLVILRDRILSDAIDFTSESEDIKKLVNELYIEINDFIIPGMDEEDLEEEN